MRILAFTVAFSAAASSAITYWFMRVAIRLGFLDHPNERSSHREPTPRGGGLAIALVLIAAATWSLHAGWLEPRHAYAYLGGVVAVATVGLLDDVWRLRARWKLLGHILAAAWLAGWLGGLPEVRYGDAVLVLGPAGYALASIGTIWLINLYNFMDGADGLAATQALLASSFGAVLLSGLHPGLALMAIALAGAAAGFLVWNAPPARVFLGDVGSYTIGFTFAYLGMVGESAGALPSAVWLLLLSPFIVDATLTLLDRCLGGEIWYQAHRDHAYQRCLRLGAGHGTLLWGLILITVALIWPLAWYAAQGAILKALAVALAFNGLLWLGIRYRFKRHIEQ